jgi:hypothetical protein
MSASPHASLASQLVWVTPSVAINPAAVFEVFHGKGGHIEVHFPGRTRQLLESDLTDAGRALLLPPSVSHESGAPEGIAA